MLRFIAVNVLAVLSLVGTLSAQVVPEDTAVATALRQIRNGSTMGAVPILTQKERMLPRDRLDTFADSLLAIAVAYRPGESVERLRAAMAARTALAVAGSPRYARPYAGALERLIQIYDVSEEVGIKAGTLWSVTTLPQTAEATAFLRRVAISSDRTAYRAVELLARDMGEQGLRVARGLFESDAVTERHAREVLAGIASYHGW